MLHWTPDPDRYSAPLFFLALALLVQEPLPRDDGHPDFAAPDFCDAGGGKVRRLPASMDADTADPATME